MKGSKEVFKGHEHGPIEQFAQLPETGDSLLLWGFVLAAALIVLGIALWKLSYGR